MELSRVYNCNKLALGHHLDDVVATLIMNMSQHGRFAGMAIKLNITVGDSKYPLSIIRPLCCVAEDDIRTFIVENDFTKGKIDASMPWVFAKMCIRGFLPQISSSPGQKCIFPSYIYTFLAIGFIV